MYSLPILIVAFFEILTLNGAAHFSLAEGVKIHIVGSAARDAHFPLCWMGVTGKLRGCDGLEWDPSDPETGGMLRGRRTGPRDIDIVFKNESATSYLTILSTLWKIKILAESSATKKLIGRPNVIIYLRTDKLTPSRR